MCVESVIDVIRNTSVYKKSYCLNTAPGKAFNRNRRWSSGHPHDHHLWLTQEFNSVGSSTLTLPA
jgi:hypothetical protein